jgi:hypothetical protein
MHLDLRALGYEGSYDRVAAFARQWKVDQLERVNSASKSTLDLGNQFLNNKKAVILLLFLSQDSPKTTQIMTT